MGDLSTRLPARGWVSIGHARDAMEQYWMHGVTVELSVSKGGGTGGRSVAGLVDKVVYVSNGTHSRYLRASHLL
jgi:hypothetical protein